MVKDMTKGSPMKLILGFAIPMLMGMLFQQFYNLVDTMIVGKTLGVDALAGVGATACINLVSAWEYVTDLRFLLHSSLEQANIRNSESMYTMDIFAALYFRLC